MRRQLRTIPNVARGVGISVRYYVRDLFRGPHAETTFGFFGSSIGVALLIGGLLALLVV